MTVIGKHIDRHGSIHDRLAYIITGNRSRNNLLHEEVIELRLTTVRVQPDLTVIERTCNLSTRLTHFIRVKRHKVIFYV